MDFAVKAVLSQFEGEMDAYYALLMMRLMNLCVKANPVSLLPVVVEADEQEKVFEEVADVSVPDEDHLDVYPKLDEFIFNICKGVMEVHPEFDMSQETYRHGDEDIRYLRFTMPAVNSDRRDVLNQGVDAFYEEAKKQFKETKAKYLIRLTEKVQKVSKEDADQAQDRFDNNYKTITDMAEDLINDKKKEIEEAYQRYLEKEAVREQEAQEQLAAEGEDMKSKLKLPFGDE